MKDPQIISIAGENPDLYIMVWGGYVIDDTTQAPITTTPIDIEINLFDVTDGSTAVVNNASMVYDTGSKFWRIAFTAGTPTLASQLVDRHKYVARVSEDTGTSLNMREFVLEEFAVDNGSFEETLMRLPFVVKPHPTLTTMHIIWYNVGQIDVAGQEQFMAPVYESVGPLVAATDPTRVICRGAIVPYA